MFDPLFWLGLSILLVAVSLTAVLVAALPAFRELARAARSAEKLFDTLSRELPPTLEAIRLTGVEISDLTDDVSEGVQSAGRVVKQFDESIRGAKKQAKKAQSTTRSLVVGLKAAWRAFKRPATPPRRSIERLSSPDKLLEKSLELNDYPSRPSSFSSSSEGYAAAQFHETTGGETSENEYEDEYEDEYDEYENPYESDQWQMESEEYDEANQENAAPHPSERLRNQTLRREEYSADD